METEGLLVDLCLYETKKKEISALSIMKFSNSALWRYTLFSLEISFTKPNKMEMLMT